MVVFLATHRKMLSDHQVYLLFLISVILFWTKMKFQLENGSALNAGHLLRRCALFDSCLIRLKLTVPLKEI